MTIYIYWRLNNADVSILHLVTLIAKISTFAVFMPLHSHSCENTNLFVWSVTVLSDQFSNSILRAHQHAELLHTVYTDRLRTEWKCKCKFTEESNNARPIQFRGHRDRRILFIHYVGSNSQLITIFWQMKSKCRKNNKNPWDKRALFYTRQINYKGEQTPVVVRGADSSLHRIMVAIISRTYLCFGE